MCNVYVQPLTAADLVPVSPGRLVIGLPDRDAPPDVAIQGMGVERAHAVLESAGGRVLLRPQADMTTVDGIRCPAPVQLTSGECPPSVQLTSGECPPPVHLTSGECPPSLQLTSGECPPPVQVTSKVVLHVKCLP